MKEIYPIRTAALSPENIQALAQALQTLNTNAEAPAGDDCHINPGEDQDHRHFDRLFEKRRAVGGSDVKRDELVLKCLKWKHGNAGEKRIRKEQSW